MKHSKRILAYSAFALIVMLAVVAAIAPAASSVALAQTTVPAAPDVSATSTTDTSITISWNAVDTAVTYQVQAYDEVGGHRPLDDVSAPMTTITDSNLNTGRAYFYWVRAINSDGGEGPWSARTDIVAGSAPATPSNLAGTAGFLQNSLTWDAVADADHYEVWGRLSTEANNYRELDPNQASTSYSHTGLTAGQSWYYWVRAVDSNGTKGLYAGPAVLTVLAQPTGGVPTNVDPARGNTQITLTWDAPTAVAGVTISGYEFRHREAGGTFPETWTADANSDRTETITGLTNGQSYDFEVRATSNVGTGNAASASGTPSTVPGVPTNFSASATHNTVTLSWGVPADDGGDAVDAYRIEYLNAQNSWVDVNTVPATSSTTYTHRSRTRATEYQYRIYARNAAGEGSGTSTSIITLANAPGVPGAPVAVTATAVTVAEGGGKVDLGWTAPAFNGGSTITAYYYRFKEDTASNYPSSWRPAGQMEDGSGPNTTIQVETGLTPGKTYTFQVIAENGVGRGDPTESGTVDVESTPPVDAPVIRVTAAADTDMDDDQIRINWDALGGTDDGDGDNTTNIISGYTLQWKSSRYADTDDATDTTEWPEDDAATTEDQVVGFMAADDDNGLFGHVHNTIAANTPILPGTTYTYRVRALNEQESVVRGGPWSAEKSYATPANTPSAPAAPDGEGVDSDSIKIDWEPPDNDGGADITSYELQVRSGDAMFTQVVNGATVENTGNSTITNLPASRTEHTQDGVRDGVMYYYRVRAVNSAGKGDWSPANATAFTTLTAAAGTPAIITNLDATSENQAAGSVPLTWTEPDQGALPITRYDIQIQRVDDNDEADNTADIADWSDAVTVQPTPPTMAGYTHMNAAGDAIYHYRIRAVNGRGPGDYSTTEVTATFSARNPGAPVLTAIATGPTDILLEWNVPQSNGAEINGFQLQRWNPDLGTPAWEDVGTDMDDQTTGHQSVGPTVTLYTDSNRVAGTKYDYRIRALPQPGAQDGDAGHSETDSATTPTGLPERPVDFREPEPDNTERDPVDPADDDEVGEITLRWNAPADGGLKLTGYELEILDISTRTWKPEETLAADAESYTDEDLEPGKTYYYILRAVNSAGPGAWTPHLTAVAQIGVPEAPVLTATAASRRAINLTWTVPADNGRPITGYQIQRWNPTGGTNNDGEFTDTNLLTGDRASELVTEFTDEGPAGGLNPGTEYFYRIRALTGTVEELQGAWSAEEDDSTEGAESATTLGDVPGMPDQDDFSAVEGADAGTAALNWTEPDDEGGSSITGYSVQRYNSDTGSWDVVATTGATIDDGTAVTDAEYTDKGLTSGTTYYYRVAAVNAHGTGAYTAYDEVMIDVAAPDMPILEATATGPRSIRLTWNIPADNGTPITGFEIEKWGDDDPDTDGIQLGWVDFGADVNTVTGHQSATATQTFYVDSEPALSPNTRYDYRIRATPAQENDPYALAYATTHVGAPDRPQNVSATAEGEIALKIEWDEPLTNNGSPIDRYEIWTWDRTTKSWGWNGVAGAVHTVSHPVTTFTHSGLTAGTQNIYRVRAVNAATNDNNGVGQWSTIFTGRTDE